jgi:hypothetical protein
MEFRFRIESAAQVRAKVKAFAELTGSTPTIKVRGTFKTVEDKAEDPLMFIYKDEAEIILSEKGKGGIIETGAYSGVTIDLSSSPDPDFSQMCILCC